MTYSSSLKSKNYKKCPLPFSTDDNRFLIRESMIAEDWMTQQWNYAVEYLPVNCFGYSPQTQAVMHTTSKIPSPLNLSQNSPMLLHLGYPWRWLDNSKNFNISLMKSTKWQNNYIFPNKFIFLSYNG